MTCCGVTQNDENGAIKMIDEIEKRRKKDSVFVVSGCLPSFARERILATSNDSILITYKEFSKFDDLISAKVKIEDVYFNINPTNQSQKDDKNIAVKINDSDEKLAGILDEQFYSDKIKKQYAFCTLKKYIWQGDDVYQIKVSCGCPGHCSYCATKLAIGDFQSVSKELVLKQFREGINKGYRYFLLMGDEIGCYGSDFGENIIDLLDEVYKMDSTITLGIRYIHPDIFVKYYNGLKNYFSNGFINYFCCAIQSASPSILKSMNRNPNMEPFMLCMEDMNQKRYEVNKHTQILVGFPGETAEDVLDTLNCLIRCNFDHININKYSPRKGTKAFEMIDDVPEDKKVRRCSMFREWMMLQKKGKLYDAIKEVVL
jgi:tRNA A37 methylthiotransferase MiaB